ncbi:MAG: hypothetical protein KDA28_09590 [Phycisphaerales bacterium]|nr:hypothetical protein [Phycisphaerales bacterium]
MTRFASRFVSLIVAFGAAHAAPALAQPERPGATTINQMCPIGKEPVASSAGTVEHGGHAIGLCCPGCARPFLAWDDVRKDEFITLAIAHREPGQDLDPHEDAPAPVGEAASGPTYPYTLPGCPVGGPLGSMGEPIVKVYDNREVRFCCASCVGKFEADPARYWGEIDAKIVEQQRMHYPITTCIVSGNDLGADAIDHVHNNRLVRLADAKALDTFRADPATYLGRLDKAIVKAQMRDYPMDVCPVGGPLGSMGEPVEFIFMNRLVRLCCAACEAKIENDPAAFMAKLDAAYAEQQRKAYPLDTCVVSNAPLDSMGGAVELVAGTRLVRFCCDSCFPKFRKNPEAFLSKIDR